MDIFPFSVDEIARIEAGAFNLPDGDPYLVEIDSRAIVPVDKTSWFVPDPVARAIPHGALP